MATIPNNDDVARVIFSPKMVRNGVLLLQAFTLTPENSEKYLSVLWTSQETWNTEVYLIPENEVRKRYGYALMNVGEVVDLNFSDVLFEVKHCPSKKLLSHSGIYVTVNDKALIGGKNIEDVPQGFTQDSLLLQIRNRLRNLAQKRLFEIEKPKQD